MSAVRTLSARVSDIAEAVDSMATALAPRVPSRKHARIIESMIHLDVEAMITALASVNSDPVVQRVVLRCTHRDIRKREVLHHLQGNWVDQITRPNRQLIRSS